MVKNAILILLLAFIAASCGGDGKKDSKNRKNLPDAKDAPQGKIILNGSAILTPMLQSMSDAFVKEYPSIMIEVKAENDSVAASSVAKGTDDIYLCSGPVPEKLSKFEKHHLATDVIVLIVNFNNPVLQRILIRGLALSSVADIFYKGSIISWGSLFNTQVQDPLKAYMLPNSSGVDAALREWMKAGNNNWFSSQMKTEQEVLSSVLNNPGGIGFCGSHLAYNAGSGYRIDGIYILPVDLNNNRTAEDNELLYDNQKQLSANIQKGLVPSQLIRQHFLVYNASSPHIDMIRLFIDWVGQNGLNYCSRFGFFGPTVPSETTKKPNK